MLKTINKFSPVKITMTHLILFVTLFVISYFLFQKIERFENIPGSKKHFDKIQPHLPNYIKSIKSIEELNQVLKMLFVGLNDNLKKNEEVKMLQKIVEKTLSK